MPPALDPFARRFPGGIAFDWTQRTYLGIPTLHETLRAVVEGPLGGQKIDVYASDACLMQSIEVAAELGDVARYLVGSTQIEELSGLPYRDLLVSINSGRTWPGCQGQPTPASGDAEACSLAHLIPGLYRDSFRSGLRARLSEEVKKDPSKTFTMSAIETSELSASLLPALAQLGRDLAEYLEAPNNRSRVKGVLGDLDAGSLDNACSISSSTFLGNYRDLGVFLTQLQEKLRQTPAHYKWELAPEASLMKSIERVRGALQKADVEYAYGTGYPAAEGFRALSVWLPPEKKYYQCNRDQFAVSAFYRYGKQAGAAAGPWQTWLDRVYDVGGAGPPAAVTSAALAPDQRRSNPNSFSSVP
jgi:hypothetical protein